LAAALGLPDGVVICPWGVLAIGWPAPAAGDAPTTGAPKPAVADMYFGERWGRPSPAPVG
jgi:hypothetical protein